MQFKNTENYITTEDLEMAVNAAINLEKPLLVKGEPGTGKTELAKQVSQLDINASSPQMIQDFRHFLSEYHVGEF